MTTPLPWMRRRGAAIVMVLVATATLSVVLAVVTVQAVAQQQLARQRHHQLQAEWLARAGVELAADRLLKKPADFSAERSDLAHDAKVRIVVRKKGVDMYLVGAEAEVGTQEKPVAVRTLSVVFQRTDDNGTIRLTALPPANQETP